jgi:nitrogen fixation/metabolism regulation signal transduction histidine kinase
MVAKSLKKFTAGRTPIVLLLVLLFVSLYLMSSATQNSQLFDENYSTLLLVNLTALVLLVALIGRHLTRLVIQYRRREPGSRLTARLVVIFSILAVAPILVLYYFSMQFLHRGIDNWFEMHVDQVLENALELGRSSLDSRVRELVRQSRNIADEIGEQHDASVTVVLSRLRQQSEASELTLLTSSGSVIASSSSDATNIVPALPSQAILQQLNQGLDYSSIEPIGDRGLHVHIVIPLRSTTSLAPPDLLQALYPIAERQALLAENLQNAYSRYQQLTYLRRPLKQSFTLTLSLVLLLSLLTAVWAAFSSARRLVAPIRDLAEGTEALAAGQYGMRLPIPSRDELGFLVRSFNDMAYHIEQARSTAERSQSEVENQRAYLEAVLRRLSSGVLTLDGSGRLLTANQAACQILALPSDAISGLALKDLLEQQPMLEPLISTIEPHLATATAEWRADITLFGTSGRRVLICRGSPLSGPGDMANDGHVIVFDDITNLIQAQRDAAWGEVARRLAHEIKNPLTPIQLSAERLRHKYLHTMRPEDGEVLDRATHTIVQQVETMKTMVKAFSDYARPPRLQLEPLQLNTLVSEVVDLYQGSADTSFKLALSADSPIIQADRGRLRQLLHNLIKNAQEAGGQNGLVAIEISVTCARQDNCHSVELRLSDNGPGIPETLLGQLFEPYTTTKPKGSGLGLAIVKKIVEEHGGVISLENSAGGGAVVTLRLPIQPQLSANAPEPI